MNTIIRPLVDIPAFAEVAAEWLAKEWPDALSSAARKTLLLTHANCPPTLMAIADGIPLGVLTFRRFRRGDETNPSLFIDALYVHGPVRRSGLGTKLLASGVTSARTMERHLFVYTSLPRWYAGRGWSIAERGPDPACCVLTRSRE